MYLFIFLIFILILGITFFKPRIFNFRHFDSLAWNVQQRKFVNTWQSHTKIMSLKGMLEYVQAKKVKWKTINQGPKVFPEAHIKDKVLIHNIGHVTFLIQGQGVNILTDPVYSKRVGPFGLFGPKRIIAPGIDFEALPPIDIVVVSHNHYDHLDKKTILDLEKVHKPVYIVPLGLKKVLTRWGIKERVMECDWWDSASHKGVKIQAVPAQHWSRRGLFDTNQTLWMGAMIHLENKVIYFAGDTGLGDHFKMLRQRCPCIDVSLIPIGAYKPRNMMKHHHMSPEDAVEAHKILKPKISIPMHYDVFPLGKEAYGEAQKDLWKVIRKHKGPKPSFYVLGVGKTFELH